MELPGEPLKGARDQPCSHRRCPCCTPQASQHVALLCGPSLLLCLDRPAIPEGRESSRKWSHSALCIQHSWSSCLGLKTPSGCCSSLFICADTRGRSLGGRSRAHVRQCISGQRAVHCARGRGRLPSSSCPGRSWSPSEGLWKFYLRIKGRGATERAHTGWGPCWVHFFFFSLLLLS